MVEIVIISGGRRGDVQIVSGGRRPKLSRGESIVSGAADSVTLGFGDELKGGLDAGVAAFRGQDAGRAYRQSVDTSRAYQKRAMEDNPLSYTGGQIAGAFVPGMGVARAGRTLLQGSRGLNALAASRPIASYIGASAAGGAAGGAVYGAGSATEGNRLRGAGDAAIVGGLAGPAFGLGFKALGAAASPLTQPVQNALARGMGKAPPVREVVDRSLDRMARRAGLTENRLEEIAQEAEATGRNPLMAQVLGEPGLQRLQTTASLPGKTPQLAADTIRAGRSGQSSRISADVDAAFGTTTRAQARQSVDERYAALAPQYDELLGKAKIPPQAEERINSVLSRIDPTELDPIRAAAGRIARYDGLTFDQLPPAQKLHYIKMGIGQRVDAMGREGLASTERQRLTVALKDFRKELEDAVPGYRDLNGRWADNVQTEEALTWANDLFAGGNNAMNRDEAKAIFDAMSPAQKEVALVSIRNRVLQKVEERAKTGQRSSNVADPFLNEAFESKIKAILGDDAAGKFMRKLRAEDRDFNELGSALPRANSKTAPVFADMVDQMATAGPSRTNVLASAADFLWQKATNPLLESARNKEGAALLKRLTPAEIRALRKTIAERMARRREDVVMGAQGAAVGSIGVQE